MDSHRTMDKCRRRGRLGTKFHCHALALLIVLCHAAPGAATEPHRVVLPDGSVFVGEIEHGLFNGDGTYVQRDGTSYSGGFRDGLFAGPGVYVSYEGNAYLGKFRDGELDGHGEIRFADGDYYRGEIHDWEMDGEGELRSDDLVYRGHFTAGRLTGKGELTYGTGERYVGGFRNGRFDGEGTYYYPKDATRDGQQRAPLVGRWRRGHYLGDDPRRARLDPESVLFRQYPLLTSALAKVTSARPGVPELFFVGFGSHGDQDVFMKEVVYTRDLFERRFGVHGHAVNLINNRTTLRDTPLATVTNLRKTLQYLSQVMNKEEDILFLFLTSHGSPEHELSVELADLPLQHLSAKRLGKVISDSGIRWKVIVVSACYSGGFIKDLADDHTMVITSAREDLTSFGCSDDADMTYFGRAFFKLSLEKEASFLDAFEHAARLVSDWEDKDHFVHSQPQISSTPLIEGQLARWRRGLAQTESHAAIQRLP